MVRLGDKHDQPCTLADDHESFTFADWAYLRISKDKVEVQGDLQAMRLPVEGEPKLLVNGKEKKASFARGHLYYCAAPEKKGE